MGFLQPGLPDCIIAIPGGRTLWIELKSEKGYLRTEQKLKARMLIAMGHEWHQVKSYKRFLEVVNASA